MKHLHILSQTVIKLLILSMYYFDSEHCGKERKLCEIFGFYLLPAYVSITVPLHCLLSIKMFTSCHGLFANSSSPLIPNLYSLCHFLLEFHPIFLFVVHCHFSVVPCYHFSAGHFVLDFHPQNFLPLTDWLFLVFCSIQTIVNIKIGCKGL